MYVYESLLSCELELGSALLGACAGQKLRSPPLHLHLHPHSQTLLKRTLQFALHDNGTTLTFHLLLPCAASAEPSEVRMPPYELPGFFIPTCMHICCMLYIYIR